MPRTRRLKPLTDHESRTTLAPDLIEVADDIRQLATDFGMRLHRVFLVWLEWPKGEVGLGKPKLCKEVEILPTPRVTGVPAKVLQMTGLTEQGSIAVDQISGSFSEDILAGIATFSRDGTIPETIKPAVSFFWETQEVRPKGTSHANTVGGEHPTDAPARRRRYHLADVPAFDANAFAWSVGLVRADGERTRVGEPAL